MEEIGATGSALLSMILLADRRLACMHLEQENHLPKKWLSFKSEKVSWCGLRARGNG
jgi:hypothetical protein